jgi:Flp pilus assembly protein TadD
LFNLAILQTTDGQVDEAITLYRKVLALEPEHAGAHLNLGFLLIEAGREKLGAAELQRAIELAPELRSRIPSQLAEEVAPPAGNGASSSPSA